MPDQRRHESLGHVRPREYFLTPPNAEAISARPNKILALKWSDVDWERSTVRITRSLYWPLGGGFEFTKPKTQKSVRTITVSALAVEALRQYRRIQLEQRMEQGSD